MKCVRLVNLCRDNVKVQNFVLTQRAHLIKCAQVINYSDTLSLPNKTKPHVKSSTRVQSAAHGEPQRTPELKLVYWMES